MYFFPLLLVQKQNETILDNLKRELEMNMKISSVTSLDYFVKNELKYYEYITHIIVDIDHMNEKDKDFLVALEALRLSTDVPIIVYAENRFAGDEILSEIARKKLANIIGETKTLIKKESKRKMKSDLREAIVRSTQDNPIGLRSERQNRFDVTFNLADCKDDTALAIPFYGNPDFKCAIGVMGSQHRNGCTTFAIQMCSYFTARGAKVAFISRNKLTDTDINTLSMIYECTDKGRYTQINDIDFYKFGYMPDDFNLYNICVFDYGVEKTNLDQFCQMTERYIVSGFQPDDLISTIKWFEASESDKAKLFNAGYNVVFNFADACMCGELYRQLTHEIAANGTFFQNLLVPYRFNLPKEMIAKFDGEFSRLLPK